MEALIDGFMDGVVADIDRGARDDAALVSSRQSGASTNRGSDKAPRNPSLHRLRQLASREHAARRGTVDAVKSRAKLRIGLPPRKPSMTTRNTFARLIALGSLAALCATALPAQRPIKVFISVDMEGIGGVVTADQLGPTGFEYAKFREYMTAEALAAIAGAREAGATEFVVADAHGNMQNLLIDRFPDGVTIIRGSPRPLMMMEGIDSSFSAAMFIGYHSATTNARGVRAHTISSATFAAVRLNGQPMSESGINAAIAGHFGVPVVMVSGDEQAVGEVQAMLGSVEGAVVKRSISFHAAAVMTPEASQALIRAKAKAAVLRLREFRPLPSRGPFQLELTYKNYTPAEMMSYLPGTERVDSHTIRMRATSIVEISRFLEFAISYRADLSP